MWSEVNESCIVWKALVVVQDGTWHRMGKSRKSEKRGSRCPGGMAWPLASFLLLSPQNPIQKSMETQEGRNSRSF